ncbi:hypothetical protein F5887DRAFT_1085355 [Amanita rubescens]|nr:hypothetical protein F5887DRAFT_1085355 [Amanita rubescens]
MGIGRNVEKKKRCPRLLHPRALGNPEDATVAHLLDPNVWWDPKTPHQLAWVKPGAYPELAHPMDQTVWWDPKTPRELVRGEPGTYRLAKRYGKRTIDSSDSFLPPFAYFSVPIGALHSTGVVPKHSELRLFGEGLAIGAKGLHFPASEAELIRWSFENHIASPLEVGHKVEIKLDAGMARGVIVDLRFEDAVVRLNDSVEAMEVDARRVRRFYEVGDKVKAVVPTNLDCEGWVVDVSDEKLAVFDRNQKEHLDVKSWQLIPHDSVEHGFARRIQVGDAVQVIYPKSPNYHEHGLVCSIADFGIEVIGHKPPNTKFWEPHWFLNVVSTTEGGVEQKDCSLAFHDRYKELINTWVVVTGNHAYKGLFGRIRDHLGQQMLSIEPTSGALPVAVHVDFLLNGEEGGPDLRRYHVGLHQTPATMGHRLPPRLHRELAKPARPTTPGADEPVTPEGGPEVDQRDRVASSPGASGPEDPPITPATASQPAAVIDPPRLERVEPMISHENQALPANWLMKHGLVAKRIWAYVRNSKTNPFEQGGGYARGFYEGERVLILSGEMEGGIEVNAKERTIIIPSYFLFPQMPTSRGQDVVVISGDNAGELYLTRKPNRDGTFPLGRRGHKGSPLTVARAAEGFQKVEMKFTYMERDTCYNLFVGPHAPAESIGSVGDIAVQTPFQEVVMEIAKTKYAHAVIRDNHDAHAIYYKTCTEWRSIDEDCRDGKRRCPRRNKPYTIHPQLRALFVLEEYVFRWRRATSYSDPKSSTSNNRQIGGTSSSNKRTLAGVTATYSDHEKVGGEKRLRMETVPLSLPTIVDNMHYLPTISHEGNGWILQEYLLWNAPPISNVHQTYDRGYDILAKLVQLPDVPHGPAMKYVRLLDHGPVTPKPELVHVIYDLVQRKKTHISKVNFGLGSAADHLSIEEVMSSLCQAGDPGYLGPLLGALTIPATKAGLGKFSLTAGPFEGSADHVYECQKDKQPAWLSSINPRGSITDPHIDYCGCSQIVQHISGRKLWLFWPPTTHNLQLFCNKYVSGTSLTFSMMTAIEEFENLELLLVEDSKRFIIPSGTIHAVITFTTSCHTGFKIWGFDDFGTAKDLLNIYLGVWQNRSHLDNTQADHYNGIFRDLEQIEFQKWGELCKKKRWR